MDIDITDLRLFVEIAEAGNLTRGARRAYLTPPAASARIKALEARLGAALLYRGNRGVSLTTAGARFLHHARLILRQLDYLRDEFAAGGAAGGHLRVYANTTAVTEFLPELLASFLADRPDASVDVQERLTRDIFRGVRDGSADMGIVSGEVPGEGIEAIPFSTDRLVLAVPEGHPLTKCARVSFAETLAHRHVGLHEGSTLLAFLQGLMDKSGYDRALRTQVRSFEAMCRMVETGVGIGVVPESAAMRHACTMRLRFIEIAEPWALRTRSVVVRDRAALPRLARALIDELVRTGAGGSK
ncbi:MAG: LysR family transcriptional regulator [Paracoccaceae bacterium]